MRVSPRFGSMLLVAATWIVASTGCGHAPSPAMSPGASVPAVWTSFQSASTTIAMVTGLIP
jgi:hypothetical protein